VARTFCFTTIVAAPIHWYLPECILQCKIIVSAMVLLKCISYLELIFLGHNWKDIGHLFWPFPQFFDDK
jgi:hypothetical protein